MVNYCIVDGNSPFMSLDWYLENDKLPTFVHHNLPELRWYLNIVLLSKVEQCTVHT